MKAATLLCAIVLAHATAAQAQNALSPIAEPRVSHKILVHITRGPEDPTRVALGFAVAKAAIGSFTTRSWPAGAGSTSPADRARRGASPNRIS